MDEATSYFKTWMGTGWRRILSHSILEGPETLSSFYSPLETKQSKTKRGWSIPFLDFRHPERCVLPFCFLSSLLMKTFCQWLDELLIFVRSWPPENLCWTICSTHTKCNWVRCKTEGRRVPALQVSETWSARCKQVTILLMFSWTRTHAYLTKLTFIYRRILEMNHPHLKS